MNHIRINTRISHLQNEWLNKRAADMGVSKSALVSFAIQNYIDQGGVLFAAKDKGAAQQPQK